MPTTIQKKKVYKKKHTPTRHQLWESISHGVRVVSIGIAMCTLVLVGTGGFAADTDLMRNLKCTGLAWGKGCDSTAPISVGTIIGLVIQVVLTLLGIIFLILSLYAGFLWMTAAGEKEKVEKAQSMLMQAVIGLIIVLAAQGVTYWVLSTLGSSIK
ncbi:MAG: hypothetical protein Q8P11_04125 [bacterium]|nr:hypothetical protein [bacterium]